MLEQWPPWRVQIGQWGHGFAPTDYVAHWCVIGHCVGVMAAHGVSQTEVLPPPTLPHPPTHLNPSHSTPPHPFPPHPTLSPIPLTPSISNTDGRKRQQKIP